MRSLLISALVCTPLAAQAQAPKQVEVINDPLAVEVVNPQVEVTNDPLVVEVVNPATPSPPVHWQLVGFTSASFVGDQGILGFTLHCHAEFTNSRIASW